MSSFFDDPSFFRAENYELCKLVRKSSEINLKKRALFEGELSVRPETGQVSTKFFRIIDRKLVYFSEKNLEKPKGFYDFLTYMRLSTDDFYDKERKVRVLIFRLQKFGKTHEFYVKDKKIYHKLLQILRLYCISNDFDTNYEIVEKIGSGHFANVYRVINKENSLVFAAKIIDKNKKLYEQKTYIFNEINILKTLPKNDHIIKLYEIYESLSELILLFEYMEGGDAYKRLKKLPSKQYDESFASFIFCQALKGLKFLHGQGVVHRDIKPENILLSDESAFPIAKIADFSLVETFQDKKMSVRCGTPGYMAPEMFSDESYSEKVDVFSLGVTLFIMLSGKSPFQGSSAEEVMEKNKSCVIKFKKKGWENVSKEARKLTSRMLAKFPGQRLSLQQVFVQRWIKQAFFDEKLNEVLKERLKSFHKQSSKFKEKEENKYNRHLSIKKEGRKSRVFNKDMPINSVNSLFINGSHRSNESSAILNLTQNSIASSFMELNKLKSGSFLGSRMSSAGSAYTLPNSPKDSMDDDEEQKDYVVFDELLSHTKAKTIGENNKMCESTRELTVTSNMIFEDDNPVKFLMKSLKPMCFQVKHCKF